jgi:omega-amidase
MKVICCQLDIVWEDKQANFERFEKFLAHAGPSADSLVVLTEMCFTGFSMNVAPIAEDEPGRTEAFLASMAERYGVYLVSGLVSRTPGGLGRNEAIFMTPPGAVEGRYQKMHLFSPAGEHLFFEPGSRVVSFAWQGGSVAPFICYDLRFPEAFRAAVDLGAELYVVIANWPRMREGHWLTLLQARAIENQAFVAGVNRCGRDPYVDYSGRSVIFSPGGEVIADAGENEGWVSAELDWQTVREYRKRFPALSDRRYPALAPNSTIACGSRAVSRTQSLSEGSDRAEVKAMHVPG